MQPKLFFSMGIDFFLDCCLKYDFMRQLHCDARFIVFFLHVRCHLALS